MKKTFLFISIFLFTLFLLSCNQAQKVFDFKSKDFWEEPKLKSENNIDYRISVHNDKDNTEVKLFLENKDTGNIVNGAYVYTILNGALTQLNYNSTAQSYSNNVPTDPNINDYIISIVSSLNKSDLKVGFKLNIVSKNPEINVLSSQSGSNILQGNPLKASEKLNIAWEKDNNATNYVVTIMHSGSIIIKKSISDNKLEIPENTFRENEAYSIYIIAQSIIGDPQYKTDKFYSLSSRRSQNISINRVVP